MMQLNVRLAPSSSGSCQLSFQGFNLFLHLEKMSHCEPHADRTLSNVKPSACGGGSRDHLYESREAA